MKNAYKGSNGAVTYDSQGFEFVEAKRGTDEYGAEVKGAYCSSLGGWSHLFGTRPASYPYYATSGDYYSTGSKTDSGKSIGTISSTTFYTVSLGTATNCTLSGGGDVEQNSSVNVTITPSSGYYLTSSNIGATIGSFTAQTISISAQDIIVTATCEKGVTYTFYAGRGSGNKVTGTVIPNTNVASPSSGFTRTGYTFDGWASSKDGEKVYDKGDSIVISSDVSYYAHYSPNTITVSFNSNGGSGTFASLSGTYGTNYTIPSDYIPTRDGYVFKGWGTDEQQPGSSYAYPSSNKTLSAQWASIVRVEFNTQGGTLVDPVEGTSSVTITWSNKTTSQFGYNLKGWFNAASGGTQYDTNTSTKFTKVGTTTVYAQWTAKQTTVTLDDNGGSGGSGTITATYDSPMPTPIDIPIKEHCEFSGYYYNNTQYYDANGCSARNWDKASTTLTLTASWTLWRHVVTFNANGGTGGPTTQTWEYGVSQAVTSTIPTRQYYTFLGWAKSASATTAEYRADQTLTYTPESAVESETWYAVWSRNQVTVTFNANGGTTSESSRVVNQGDSLNTLPNVTNKGHTLSMWNTAEDGTGTVYTASSVIVGSGDSLTLTLFAVWQDNKYYIDFKSGFNNGTLKTIQANYSDSVTYTDDTGNPICPTYDCYDFVGWHVTTNLDADGKYSSDNGSNWNAVTSNTLCRRNETSQTASGVVHFKQLSADVTSNNTHVTVTALWKRKTRAYTFTKGIAESIYTCNLSCDSVSFTHNDSTTEISPTTVDPNAGLGAIVNGTLRTINLYSGCTYRIVTAYVNAQSSGTSFPLFKDWGNGANESNLTWTTNRTNSGETAAIFASTHKVDYNGTTYAEETSQSLNMFDEHYVVTIAVSSPFTDVTPTVTTSFHSSDTTGRFLKLYADSATGVNFYQWSETPSSGSVSTNPAKFQITQNKTITASYVKGTCTVDAKIATYTQEVIGASYSASDFIKIYSVADDGTETEITDRNAVPYRSKVKFKFVGNSSSVNTSQSLGMSGSSSSSGSSTSSPTLNRNLGAWNATGWPSENSVAGWYNGDSTGDCVGTDSVYETIITGDLTLYIRAMITVTLGWATAESSYDDFDFSLVLDNNSYDFNGTSSFSCSKSVVIGESINIGCVIKDNDTTAFLYWYKTSSDSPLDFAQNENGIQCIKENCNGDNRAISFTAKLASDEAIYYCAFYNYGNNEFNDNLGQLTVTGTNIEKITRSVYQENCGTPADESATNQSESFYKISGSQKISVTALQMGSMKFRLFTKDTYASSQTFTEYKNTSSIVALVNQNLVFRAEWGSPTTYKVMASLYNGEADIQKGRVDIGVDATAPVSKSTTSSYGQYESGKTATVIAYAKNGYKFEGWYDGNTESANRVSSDSYYEFTMGSADVTLYAKFNVESISLYKWEGGSDNKTMTWKSKVYELTKPANLTAARIDATGYPIGNFTVKSYSSPDKMDSNNVNTVSLTDKFTSQTMKRLPTKRPERFFNISIQSDSEVDAIILGTSGSGLAV